MAVIAANELRSALRNHHCRCIGIAGRDGGHDRGINDPQAFDAMHTEFIINHRVGVMSRSHLAGANWMKDGGA